MDILLYFILIPTSVCLSVCLPSACPFDLAYVYNINCASFMTLCPTVLFFYRYCFWLSIYFYIDCLLFNLEPLANHLKKRLAPTQKIRCNNLYLPIDFSAVAHCSRIGNITFARLLILSYYQAFV